MHTGLTRRRFVSCAVLAGAAAAVPGGSAASAATTASVAEVLGKALAVERLVVLAYTRVLASGALARPASLVVGAQLDHERAHVRTLARAMSRLGAKAPTAPVSVASAQKALGKHHVTQSLSDLRTQHDCIKLLVDVETAVEGAYHTAITDLGSPQLRRISAEIMACEAQHWTALSQLQHGHEIYRTVPYPFVVGTK